MPSAKTAPSDSVSRFAVLTAKGVERLTDSGSFTRGRAYFREGRIHDTVRRDATIEGLCTGSDVSPYRVKMDLPLRDIPNANHYVSFCTCPVDGFCKHLVALCLAWVDDPGRFVERPSLTESLADRSREDLVALIVRMVTRYPDLERLVMLPSPGSPGEGSANVPTVDERIIRQQARSAFDGVDRYDYYAATFSVGDLEPLLDLGRSYVDVGHWADALTVYATVAEEAREVMLEFNDHDGVIGALIANCAMGLVACFDAQAELPPEQRLAEELRERLIRALYDIWRFDVIEVGGIDLAQEGPESIARNVTDAERAMVEGWLGEERPSDWARSMVVEFQIMLKEEAGLDDEQLLKIYNEAELWDDVAAMLLQLDRVDEAVSVAARKITAPQEFLDFANALIGRGGEHVAQAITLVDDRVWEAEGKNPVSDVQLQEWLVARFSEHQRPREALAIAQRRFKAQPTLQTWGLVEQSATLTGQPPETWTDLRPKLLAQLRKRKEWTTLVEIHLGAGDIGAAIEANGRHNEARRKDRWSGSGWGYGDQELRLAAAAEADFPDDAVAIYRHQADGMIANRQRASYTVAAGHLARVKATLERHGRADEWTALIAEVRTTNKMLRALREELDALGL